MTRRVRLEDFVNDDNIARRILKWDEGDRLLETIAGRISDDYDEDEQSRREWVDRTVKGIENATQIWKHKSFPWPNAANVRYPLQNIASMNFHARAYPLLMPSRDLVTAKISGDDPQGIKREGARRINTHMTWQLREEMHGWEEGMDRLLITLPNTGSEFKKTYFDPQLGRNVSEYVSSFDLVVNYWAKDLETAARKTHILETTPNELEEFVRAGLFLDVDLGEPVPRDDQLTQLRERGQGSRMPSRDDDYPYMLLEWHGFLDLDDDGYKEPYVVTIEKYSRKVLRVVARFDDDDIEYRTDSRGSEVLRIQPQEYFTHYRFIPSPDGGFYGMGFNNLIGPLNGAVDTIINQLLDAGTLQNMPSGFLSRQLRIQGGNYRFRPGEWKWVNAMGQDLKNAVMQIPVPNPSPVLFNLLSMLIDSGKQLTSTTDIMVGENPGQNQKATTTMAVIENGMKVFTAIYKRIRLSLGEEYKKIFELNQEHVDFEGYWAVVDSGQDSPSYQQQMTDYQLADLDVVPSANPDAVSHAQRLQMAEVYMELMQTGLVNPQVAMDRVLDAMEVPRKEELMQLPPPQPDPEIQLKAAEVQEKTRHNKAEEQIAILKIQADSEGTDTKVDAAMLKTALEADSNEEDRKVQRSQGVAGASSNKGAS